jgi:hypothetical protein
MWRKERKKAGEKSTDDFYQMRRKIEQYSIFLTPHPQKKFCNLGFL